MDSGDVGEVKSDFHLELFPYDLLVGMMKFRKYRKWMSDSGISDDAKESLPVVHFVASSGPLTNLISHQTIFNII